MLLSIRHDCWGQALRGARLMTGHRARATLGHPECLDQVVDRGPAASRAQKFPRFNSLSMSMSNA
jgi:hypothetical protein